MSPGHQLPAAAYEVSDASTRGLLLTALGLATGIAVALIVAAALYLAAYADRPKPDRFGRQTSFRQGAAYRTSVAADWAEQDAAVKQNLHTYGWIDRPSGIVRIPIDRAMQRLLDESAAQSVPPEQNGGSR